MLYGHIVFTVSRVNVDGHIVFTVSRVNVDGHIVFTVSRVVTFISLQGLLEPLATGITVFDTQNLP